MVAARIFAADESHRTLALALRDYSGRLFVTLLTLVMGAAGGAAGALAGVPAGWLSGAMIVVGVATLSGVPTLIPNRVRDVVYVFLGATIGTGVSPEAVEGIAIWPLSIAALAVAVAALIGLCMMYLTRIAGWDRRTAFFASIPGALSYVMALAMTTGGVDVRRVAVSQSLRLLLLVAILPAVIVQVGSADAAATLPPGKEAGAVELVALLAACAVSGLIFLRVGVPGGLLTGAFAASAALHGTGLIAARLPDILLIPGIVVLGAMIGTRFTGARWHDLRVIAATSVAALAIAMTVSLAGASAVSWSLGLPFGQTLLAFAPGGLDVMTLLAFALNLDPAYVAAHQVVRYVMVALLLPLMMRVALGGDSNKIK